ncbi:MAG: YIP1 family protein [Hydrogenothermaceae bacterium]|nr:YIP1 family protein [Hydrogenothermaceae bacterium]
MEKFLKIYLNPKENLKELERLNWSVKDLILRIVLPFSLFAPLGYLIGFTILKSNYISGITQFLDYLKEDQKADKGTVEYMNKVLNMLSSDDYNRIFMFIGIIWVFELLRPVILNGIVFFFGRSFGSQITDQRKTFTLVSFSLIPLWISGIFNMVNSPITTFILFLSSFYTYYMIFIGAEKLLGILSENSKSFQFIIVVVIFNLIISGILGMLQTRIIQSIL